MKNQNTIEGIKKKKKLKTRWKQRCEDKRHKRKKSKNKKPNKLLKNKKRRKNKGGGGGQGGERIDGDGESKVIQTKSRERWA